MGVEEIVDRIGGKEITKSDMLRACRLTSAVIERYGGGEERVDEVYGIARDVIGHLVDEVCERTDGGFECTLVAGVVALAMMGTVAAEVEVMTAGTVPDGDPDVVEGSGQ